MRAAASEVPQPTPSTGALPARLPVRVLPVRPLGPEHPIADARHVEDVGGPLGVVAQLVAQLLDERAYGARAPGVGRPADAEQEQELGAALHLAPRGDCSNSIRCSRSAGSSGRTASVTRCSP